jgi:phospholipid/cholesterol/gamma-HCH transport system substrate-binding protein
MTGPSSFRNFVVGLVFLGSLFMVGVATLKVTGLSLTGHTQRIRVFFDKVSGLRPGDEVRIYGYRVGQVEEIEPLFGGGERRPGGPPLPLRVTIRVNRELPLTRDTSFLVKSSGPLGGSYLDIVPGKGDQKASDADFQGTANPDLFEELSEVVRENREGLRQAISQIRDAVKAINDREGTIGALIRDPDLRDRVAKAIENIEAITQSIREGKGTVGKLIMDEQIHDSLQDLLARAQRIVAEVEEGRGTLGVLLKDEELGRNLKEGVSDLRETIAKVNHGEGTVGQLINNREAWDRLVFVLRQVQEAVEDFREQAPINTFVNAIFSGL